MRLFRGIRHHTSGFNPTIRAGTVDEMAKLTLHASLITALFFWTGCDDSPSGPGGDNLNRMPPLPMGGNAGGTMMGMGGAGGAENRGGQGGMPDPECADGEVSSGPCVAEQGVCANGTAQCQDGQWGPCQYPDTHETTESVCDGLDNDCDGAVDEAAIGLGEPCDSEEDDDLCAQGTLVCAPDGTTACEGDSPRFEVCNGLDDDCDGTSDEDSQDPPAASMQSGVCTGATQVCIEGAWAEPDYAQFEGYEPSELTCDGLDNDCDDRVDTPLFAPSAQRQEGVCAGQLALCGGESGWLEPDYTLVPGYEDEESTCDGLDNDCDGLADEAYLPPPCALELGVCARPRGPARCLGADGFADCDYGADYQAEETDTCDALDNDCDGETDEGLECARAERSVRVAPGVYEQGSTAEDPEARPDELRREVTLTRPLLVRVTEVAQAEWVRIMGENPSGLPGADRPVESISWTDAIAFTNAVSEADGLEPCYEIDGDTVRWPRGLDCEGWRLPTEAEWEYLARGSTDTPRWSEDLGIPLSDAAWYRSNANGRTQPVGTRAPNLFGLHDVLGNVSEWVWDRYGPYTDGPVNDPLGAEDGVNRVGRGGTFRALPPLLRSASRVGFHPNTRNDDLGIRMIRTLRGGEGE